MDILLDPGDIVLEVVLGKNLSLSLTFVDVILLVCRVVVLLVFDGIDHVLISVHVLVHEVVREGRQSVVFAHFLGNQLVSGRVLLIQDDEHQVETR